MPSFSPRRFRRGSDPHEEKLWAYRKAAAVLASFDPLTLKPVGTEGEAGEALSILFEDCVVAYSRRHERRWMLETSVRIQALMRLASRKNFIAALAVNEESREDDLLQTMFAAYIRGTAPSLEEQTVEQLSATLQAVLWLRPVLNVPDLDRVRQRLDEKRMVEPFTFLVGDSFAGRTKELEALRTYVGVLPPQHLANRLGSSLRRFVGLKQRAPLMIHGPGGSGKSTLLAKFILEHLQVPPDFRFPWVYLDFEDPYLRLDEVDTWIAEAIRQLRIQYRSLLPESEWDHEPEAFQHVGVLLNETLNRKAENPPTLREKSQLISAFAKAAKCVAAALGPVSDRDPPLLVVFDSFEEAQYTTPQGVEKLWNLIGELQVDYDTLRVVISGRAMVSIAPINKRTLETLELGELDQEAAIAFLRKQGVTDTELAMTLFKQVHGNPLSLKLASEVVKNEGSAKKGVEGLQTSSWLLFDAGEAVVQGQLYTRILAHIREENVRKLAHPGLVLRRITPELIMNVLQKPCGVEVQGPEEANQLFDQLRRVVSLVSIAEDGSLHHRPDLRRVMLKLLERDKPEQVKEIDQAAIEYYQNFDDVVSRAEEIYHRLRLGQTPSEIDERWLEGVQEALGNAFDDLPEKSRQYLLARLTGKGLDSVDLSSELTERQLARELEPVVYTEPHRVLVRLREVLQHNRGSVLLAIEVRALMAVGDIEEALAVAARAIPEAEETGSRDSLGTLLVTAAAAAEQLGRWDEAVEYLRRAERVADAQQDPVAELDLSAQRFRILYENMPDSPELKVIANDIANRYFSLSNQTLINNDAVLRHVAAAVGPIRPDVLGRALKLVAIPPLEPEQRKMLVSALESKEGTPEQVWLADSFRRTLNLPPPPQWRTIVDAASNTSRLSDFMQRILAAEHGDNRIGVTLAELIDTSTHSHHMRP